MYRKALAAEAQTRTRNGPELSQPNANEGTPEPGDVAGSAHRAGIYEALHVAASLRLPYATIVSHKAAASIKRALRLLTPPQAEKALGSIWGQPISSNVSSRAMDRTHMWTTDIDRASHPAMASSTTASCSMGSHAWSSAEPSLAPRRPETLTTALGMATSTRSSTPSSFTHN